MVPRSLDLGNGMARLEGGAPQGRLLLAGRIIGTVITGATVLRYGWITDDALITGRHAVNLAHCWGLGFNIDERVQAFTHPLWFLLVSSGGALTGTWPVLPILLGAACSTASAAVILRSARSLARVIAASDLLLLSNAFIEYGTSGLETRCPSSCWPVPSP